MSDETTLTFGGPLRFTTLDGQPIELRGAVLVLDDDSAQLRFHVDAAGYRRIRDRALFNLFPLVVGDLELPADADDIELAARLRPELFADLRAAEVADEAIAGAFAGSAQGGVLGALTATESWLAESAVAPVAPPPGIEGTLKSGGTTAWKSRSSEAAPALRELAVAFFGEVGTEVEAVGDSLVRAPILGDAAEWLVLVRFEADRCTFASVHPDEVPDDHIADVAAFLAARNREITGGAFDIDPIDGQVRLRSTMFAGTNAATFERAARANLETFDAHAEILARLFRGEIDAAEARAELP